jgi:UDP-glucose 4-epimerase
VIFASSGGTVYGRPQSVPIDEQHPTNPVSAYGVGKLAIEKFLHLYDVLHGLSYRVLRMSNVYGEGQSPFRGQGAVAVFSYRALQGLPIEIWGDGTVIRDYVHVDDVSRAFLALMNHEGNSRIFNIGSGEGLSLNALLDKLEAVLATRIERRYLGSRKFDVPANVLNVALARDELHWQAEIPLDQGLRQVVRWMAGQNFETPAP